MSRLLQIPLEIRLHILKHVFGHSAIPYAHETEDSWGPYQVDDDYQDDDYEEHVSNPDVATTLTCRQLYHEAMSVIVSKETFEFSSLGQLRNCVAPDRVFTRFPIQRVKVIVGTARLIIFGYNEWCVCRNPSEEPGQCSHPDWPLLEGLSIFAKHNPLRYLCVSFPLYGPDLWNIKFYRQSDLNDIPPIIASILCGMTEIDVEIGRLPNKSDTERSRWLKWIKDGKILEWRDLHS